MENLLDLNGVRNDPTRNYKTGLLLDYQPGYLVGRKGTRSIYAVTSGSKGNVTIMGCGNAAATMLPLMILQHGKRPAKAILEATLKGWAQTATEKGWMMGDAFLY